MPWPYACAGRQGRRGWRSTVVEVPVGIDHLCVGGWNRSLQYLRALWAHVCKNDIRQFNWALTQINERDRIGLHTRRSTFNINKFGFLTVTKVSGLSVHPSITSTHSCTQDWPSSLLSLPLRMSYRQLCAEWGQGKQFATEGWRCQWWARDPCSFRWPLHELPLMQTSWI